MPTTDRRWTEATRELVVSVLWTRACQGGNAGPALQLQPAAEAPMHLWADAAAVLGALSGAGLLADPQELERLRAERENYLQAAEGAGAAAADMQAERDEARARVAELEQMVTDRSCRMCGGSHLVGGGLTLPCPACDVDGRPQPGWERHYCGTTGAQPGRWQLPPEPGPEVTELWDREGVRWERTAPHTWSRSQELHRPWWMRTHWLRLLHQRGPLSATPPETAGGEQA